MSSPPLASPLVSTRLAAVVGALACVAAGAALGLAFGTRFAPWVVTAALGVLYAAIRRTARVRSAAALGACFGAAWFVAGVHWIYISLHDYGDMPAWLAGTAVLAFSAYLAVFPALACAAWAWIATRRASWVDALMFAACWAATEWLRGTLFTGFPWIAVGYAYVDAPLAGFAPIGGMPLVDALAALLGACAATSVARHATTRAARAVSVAVIAIVLGAGAGLRTIAWTHPRGAPITVRLLQGNVAQDIKFRDDTLDQQLALYERLATAKPADLVVMPETAMPAFAQTAPDAWFERLAQYAHRTRTWIVFGIPIAQLGPGGVPQYFNSAQAILPDEGWPMLGRGAPRYDKHHLVPFGEFIPFGFRWFVDAMHMPLGDFNRGDFAQPPMPLAGQSIAVDICYEDLFGTQIAAPVRGVPGSAPATMLINLSNIGWFGDSAALPQHLLASRMRALETGRPMLRATNTGITAAIDPHGAVQAALAPLIEDALDVRVQGMDGTTPYVRWGDAPWLALVFGGVGLGAWRRRSAPRASR